MEYRPLGQSGLMVSAVGFGTCQLRLLPERQAIDTLLTGFDHGVNIVHTGPDYGAAEDLVARALARTERRVIVAAHGADVPSAGRGRVRQFEAQFETAAARFGRERLDLFGIACIDDREAFKENVWGRGGMVEFLQRKKQEGRLTASFCTTHGSPEYVRRLVTSGAFDAVMLAYNVLGYHLLSCYPTPGRQVEALDRAKTDIFPLCRQHGVGLMVMKPLAGGLLCDSRAFPPLRTSSALVRQTRAREVLRAILQNTEVSCVMPGTNSPEEAEENARSGHLPHSVTAREQDHLGVVVNTLKETVCSRCGECEPLCSQQLSVSWMFRAGYINLQPSARHEVLEHVDYFRLHPELNAVCESCVERTCVCPSGIDIPKALTDLHHGMVDLAHAGIIPGPMPGEPRVRVARAVPDASPAPARPGAGSLDMDRVVAEHHRLYAEVEAYKQQALDTDEQLRATRHVVDAIRSARAYKMLRRLGRWKGVEEVVATLDRRVPPHQHRRAGSSGVTVFDADADGPTGTMDLGTPAAPLHDWDLSPFVHPLEAAHGYGGHLIDLRGRDFIDFSSAWGANILGYGYPRVAEAMAEQARRFTGIGMPYPGFRELERLLCDVIPGAEEVRFGKNGSDATMGAVRLARAVTKRERVLHRGYHGFHDWWMASTDCQGIPAALRSLIEPLQTCTPDAVERAFHRRPGEIACLILDPMLPPTLSADTVRAIRDITHRNGALLIFDEVVSGFRVAPGGMQEVWGVTPDLACYGKAIANGAPLSVLSGTHEHMRHVPAVKYGMTFEGEAVSIAAGLATIHEIIDEDVCGALARKGQSLMRAYASIAALRGIPTRLAGPCARPHLAFDDAGGVPARELRWLLIQELARAGVLTVGTFSVCYSHDEHDLLTTIGAFDTAMEAVGRAIAHGSVAGLLDPRLHRGLTEKV